MLLALSASLCAAYGRYFWPSKPQIETITRSDIDEIHEELKKLDTQQEFLKLYPLGYTVFDVDFVTGSVTQTGETGARSL